MTNPDVSQPIRVVVVEDDPTTRKMIVRVLESMPGYSVVAEFGEGRSAIHSLDATRPDLMLIDLGLPDIPGLQVIRDTIAVCPKCDVLVISTFGDENSVFTALAAGANGYLLKGGTEEEVRRDILSLRTGGSPLSPAVARKVILELNKRNENTADIRMGEEYAHTLTNREIKILEMIGRGHTYEEAAKIFGITRDTIHAHLKSIYRKLAVHSKMEAVYEARRKNIIS